ncbi:carboxymuconolactone decarboxylase family protein [Sphingomonas sp. SUN019]|uniref:(R)-mandelonitrile lyase n=1 Tax=Sphingomonas sp. SUN019 TaxID=2937788 RepID=UPI002164D71C|nr:carboxymuconolactone decarboxylase family protein [Sphingomonas sp. SUN019]UVO50759.1 carboxymuconolactone decarboxylase family protein [Sphingomonas sp. SUN019]
MKFAAAAAMTLATAAPAIVDAQQRRSVAPQTMQRVAPVLVGYTDDVLFGDIWLRPDLKPRDRSIVTLSVLIATGKTAQLPGHLNRGLANGIKPTEVAGMVTQLAFYSGWPNAVSALTEIDKIFTERKIDATGLKAVASATAPVPESDAARTATVQTEIAPVAPKFAGLTNDVIFRDLWRRTDLSPRDRSLVTIAALAAGGDTDQLAFLIGRGLENGLTRAEIAEAFTHLAFYAGWPKATAAIAVLSKIHAQTEISLAPGAGLQVVAPGQSPSPAPARNFTGSAVVTSAFRGTGDARLGGATVTFQPGARTNWHVHPLGQLLVVTAGEGRVQVKGGRVQVIRAGDTVWTGPGIKHWHGAAPGQAMTHIAVSEAVNGASVTWMEPVSDAAYR